MTTLPSGEAEATSHPPDGPPEASLDNEEDAGSPDNSQGESQTPDVPAEDIPSQQEVDQASWETDTSTAKSPSGDNDEGSDAPENSQERPEEITALLPQEPGTLQMFVGFQSPVWLAENSRNSSPTISPSNSQEKPPQKSISEEEQEITPLGPNTEVPSVQPEEVPSNQPEEVSSVQPEEVPSNQPEEVSPVQPEEVSSVQPEEVPSNQPEEVSPEQPEEVSSVQPEEVPSNQPEEAQPSVVADSLPTADDSGPGLEPTSVTKSEEQETEAPLALNLDSRAGSPLGTREDLAEDSSVPQDPPFPNSSASSAPPTPYPRPVALSGRLLDPSLYGADEQNGYMRSMTSLLGGGEGSITSLADVLVWSDGAMGVGLALSLLASGHSNPADLLHEEGPSLRAVSSILDNARSAFSSEVASGTSSVLRSVTNLLHSMERRTIEGIRSAVRYLTSHLNPRWARSGPGP